MNLFEMTNEAERFSRLLDSGIQVLSEASKESAENEHALRKAVAIAWVEAPKGTVPQREAWVESETADLKRALDLAEGKRYTALEAIRSRRAQLSMLQSLLAAHRAEVDLA